MKRHLLRLSLGILLGSALLSTGCSVIPEDSRMHDWLPGKKKELEPEIPTKMAVLWTPDILIGAGKTPTRGFGGRVFYYNDRGKPVKVDGEMVIHAFDDMQSISPKNGRRYLFTADQIPTHFSESDIGVSYSYWIPWDAMGGEQKKVTLISTFQPKNGSRPIQSEAATVLLPGTNPGGDPMVRAPASSQNAIAPKGIMPASATSSAKTLGLETTTIHR